MSRSVRGPDYSLQVFKKHPDAEDVYRVGGFYSPYCLVSTEKRFTDAELAAEVWHSIVRFHGLVPSPEATEEARRNAAIERFANFPHYDQEATNA